MIRSSLVVALVVAPLVNVQIPGAPVWDGKSLPITIEVSQDVPVRTAERRADGSYRQERGALYSRNPFRIGEGQRFQMVAVLGEGSCRIEFQGSRYELSSCPWVPGFTDNQADIFRIVAFDNP